MKCRKCGTCCKTKIGPFVFPDDVPEVCDFLKIKPNIFLKEYCIKHEFKIGDSTVNIYTIKCDENGCIFLEDSLCGIYTVRPFQCKNAPYAFLGYYDFWKHMPCITPDDFKMIDTSETDKSKFKSIVEITYNNFIKEE